METMGEFVEWIVLGIRVTLTISVINTALLAVLIIHAVMNERE